MNFKRPKLSLAHSGRKRTILLLDDDNNTLFALHSLLGRIEGRVLECDNEPCALRRCSEASSSIDLLVADVVLRDGDGPSVVRKVKPLQPSMRTLYISGFPMNELERRGLLSQTEIAPGSVEFLQKPFSAQEFLHSVQRLLG